MRFSIHFLTFLFIMYYYSLFSSKEMLMIKYYYTKPIIIMANSFLLRIYHLYCFFFFSFISFNLFKKRFIIRFLYLLLKVSSFSHFKVGQLHCCCSTPRMGRSFTMAKQSAAGLSLKDFFSLFYLITFTPPYD